MTIFARPDPYLERATADMTAWLLLERAFCECEGLCECGWDDIEEALDEPESQS